MPLRGRVDVIREYEEKIGQFEVLLQRITSDLTSNVALEKMAPSDVWRRSERDITSLRDLTKQLRDLMLLLKPEVTPTIKRQVDALLECLRVFKETLKKHGLKGDSKAALEELRRASVEGANLLNLAKKIQDNPSKSLSTILRLKEVYDAKEYLSAVSIPEASFIRFENLKRAIRNLNLSILNVEQTLKDLKNGLDAVSDELSKFQPASNEKNEE